MTCPICRKTTAPRYRPFCSKRCADVDLGKWFSGEYAVPATDPEDIEAGAEDAENMPQEPE